MTDATTQAPGLAAQQPPAGSAAAAAAATQPGADDAAWGSLAADEVTLVRGGRARLVANGELHLLRPPNMGQMKSYRLALVDLLEAAKDAAADAEADAEAPADPVERAIASVRDTGADDQAARAIFDLWRLIVADLDALGQKLPTDDDAMPPWMTNINLVIRLVQHWRADPQGPGR